MRAWTEAKGLPTRILRDWTDSLRVEKLTPEAERFFVRLLMKVDDFGRFYADARLLKSHCFPLLVSLRETDISRWLAECEKAGLVVVYEAKGRKYLAIVEFRQRARAEASKYQQPEGFSPTWLPTFASQEAAKRGQVTADRCQVSDKCPTSARVFVDGDEGAMASFDEFWRAYPKRVKRKPAEDAWKKLKPDAELLAVILKAISDQQEERRIAQENKQFCPDWAHPVTWLNQKRWQDEVQPAGKNGDVEPDNWDLVRPKT